MPSSPAATGRILSHPARTVSIAFVVTIAAGTALLLLPFAAAQPGTTTPRIALFTATSALSVTGLTVVDTAGHWSTFGECVLMALMQIGGLGIMTAASVLGLVVARRLGLRTRMLVQTEAATPDLGSVGRLLASVLRISLVIEVFAWLAITLRLAIGYDEPFGRAAYLGLFHAVSAYNNAGFSLWPDSLIRFGADPWLLAPIVIAFTLGALGYPVLLEVLRQRRVSRWSLHTQLTLVTFIMITTIGSLVLTALEWTNAASLGIHGGPAGRLTAGLFSTMTAGSAGFNVIDYAQIDAAARLLTEMIMFIGGGSGGTAGGIKLTTLAVLVLAVRAEARGDTDIQAFGRRLATTTMRQALTVAVLSLAGILTGTLALLSLSTAGLDAALFEVVSAFSSSGLSTGITADLPAPAQYLLTALMVIGRIGPITVATSLALRSVPQLYRYPESRPLVG
jgi:Trk-type K+ transport system membrane component